MSKQASRSAAVDLRAIAHESMIERGFDLTFSATEQSEIASLTAKPVQDLADPSAQDMRALLWSSIDDSKTRDLDQLEYAESLADGKTKLRVAIADVDTYVRKDSAIDTHAKKNGTSVYTGVRTFPMLPEELSTDLTSLVANEDRLAVVTEMVIAADGSVSDTNVYKALVHSQAKLSYEAIGNWLDGKSDVPDSVKKVPGLDAQIRLQEDTSNRLSELRKEQGAIELSTIQATPVVDEEGHVKQLAVIEQNAARELIANFMIAANVAMAQFLEARGGPSIRRVVRIPKYWDRIVEIADDKGEKLPATPDSRALADFLARQKAADPVHFPDLSLAIVKSLGPGEYTVQAPGEEGEGHFGLAVQDYTHSTAPNRRYADLVTQRLVKAANAKQASPYSLDELKDIAAHCTEREDASRKVERKMRKVAAAVLLKDQIGREFQAIVTGATEKGTFARVLSPPVDGRIMRGERGLRVGDKVRVRLISVNAERGFIDFAKA